MPKLFRPASDTPWGDAIPLKPIEQKKVLSALEAIKSYIDSSSDLEETILPTIERAQKHSIILPADLADTIEIAKKLEKNEAITKAENYLLEIKNSIIINAPSLGS